MLNPDRAGSGCRENDAFVLSATLATELYILVILFKTDMTHFRSDNLQEIRASLFLAFESYPLLEKVLRSKKLPQDRGLE